MFGWIAVNYLMDGFGPSDADRTTYGFLDMGGASTQIAFEPSREEREKAKNLIDVRLRLMGGEEIHHQVFVTTWLGYGTNMARERYVGRAINEYEQHRPSPLSVSSSDSSEIIEDPCLPKDLRLTESPAHTSPSTSHTRKPHTFLGTGSFGQCLQRVSPLLNRSAPCPDTPCLFNGVYVPPIDFSVSHFIGVSEYWYSSEHIFGLGGAYDFVQYERAALDFCGKNWPDILQMHEQARQRGRLGGNGEVEEGGRVVGLDKWGDKVEASRLQMQCFKAAWIVNVLHEGLGMPRIVDPGGNVTSHPDALETHAQEKGLGRPTFQSIDSVGDIAISWTLGKIVLEASKDIPPLRHDSPPLVDPLDDISDTDPSHIHPIRPPFNLDFDAIEDHISAHLPPSLSRHSLGFSFVAFLFYLVVFLSVFLVIYRTRHYVRLCMRRWMRSSSKRDKDLTTISLEEGEYMNGNGRFTAPSSPLPPSLPYSRRWLGSIRKITSLWGARPSQPNTHSRKSYLRGVQSSPSRISPTRSLSYPTYHDVNSFVPKPTSASASPTIGAYDDNTTSKTNGEAGGASSLSIYSRSRNSSTISLSTLVPRQPISRTSSALQVPSDILFHDE